MGIKYEEAFDIKSRIRELVHFLDLGHINSERVFCIRSRGSKAHGVIARCHALPKIMQQVLQTEPAYIVEVIAEQFDKLDDDEKTRTLIHELLHVPKSFGGGFRHHNLVTKRKIESLFKKFKKFQGRALDSDKVSTASDRNI